MNASTVPLSPPLPTPPQDQGPEHPPRYGPAWVLSGVALSFLVLQLGWLPPTAGTDVFALFSEASICLIPLLGLFVVQHLRHTPAPLWAAVPGPVPAASQSSRGCPG